MYISIDERFPEWSEEIQQLIQRDSDFEELCTDYQKLVEWLAEHNHDDCIPESACVRNSMLLRELELEILEALELMKSTSQR